MTAPDCYSQPGLMSVDDAITQLLSHTTAVVDTETVTITNALHRVLAQDVSSGIDVPGYDNSAMDGYAVRSADCQSMGAVLAVSQRIPAGSIGVALKPGEAARIFTGAPIPAQADAVVMQELCNREDDSDQVIVNHAVVVGENIRCAGEDIANGEIVLSAGTRLRQQELGLLASVGVAKVEVYRKVRVACFFTGDELVNPGDSLQPGQIYNSNRFTINGFLQSQDCEINDYGIVPDNLDATLEVVQAAAEQADLILTSGGVSVGEEDYVRIALQQIGKLEFWRIKMKPGKPVAFGKVGRALFLGLPGNPVSVFVTAQIFACPVIRKLQAQTDYSQQVFNVRAGFEWPTVARQEYLRAKLSYQNGEAVAEIYPHQGSGVLSSACWADGMVMVKPDNAVQQGDWVPYIAFK